MTTQYIGKQIKQIRKLDSKVYDPKTGESLVAKHKALIFLFKNEAEQIYHSAQQSSAMQSW